jgi:hypothetical protein
LVGITFQVKVRDDPAESFPRGARDTHAGVPATTATAAAAAPSTASSTTASTASSTTAASGH